VGEVPPNSALHILRGDADALVAAAAQAATDATDGASGGTGFVVDCISRVLFLEDRFGEEWDAVRGAYAEAGLTTPEGPLTLGEIASDGRGFLQLYNKTCVAALVGGDG
ncbi:MAG: FIST C-terminal domain-containing protein, partial [Bacteroidota bacterium]